MCPCQGMVAATLCIVLISCGKQKTVMGDGEAGSEFESLNATRQKEPRQYEAQWFITDQPRCCSDCTYVAAGFKCKVKSCLHNCPWARSAEKVALTASSFRHYVHIIRHSCNGKVDLVPWPM